MGTLHQVLRSLLAERVPIRDLARIVETASIQVSANHTVDMVADECRAALGAQIAFRLAPHNRFSALLLVPELEGRLMAALRQVDGTSHLALEPDVLERLRDAVSGAWDRAIKGDPVALVCAPALRRPLARVLSSAGIALPVLAYRELPAHVTITATEVVGGV